MTAMAIALDGDWNIATADGAYRARYPVPGIQELRNLYPSTEDFLDEVREEVDYQVRRLGHHACLALWCGGNELIGALTWFEESRNNRGRYLVSHGRLNRTVEGAARAADEMVLWWPSSPSPGLLSFGDAWHGDRSGGMHFWSVWREGRCFEQYRDRKTLIFTPRDHMRLDEVIQNLVIRDLHSFSSTKKD